MQTDSLLKPYDRVALEEMIHESDVGNRIARELSRLEQENQRLQARVDSLDCAHKLALGEVERLRDELDAEKIASTYWQDQYNIRNDVAISVGDQLAAARAEVQRLRENAEMDKAQRAEWQETIDKLEAENASIRNQLRLALIISEPKQVDSAMERIEKMESDASRVALLEGRIQGIAEAAKERLDSHDFRLRALEANGWSGIPVTVASNIPPFNQGYNDGKPARNPFEDLRPPRGL